MANEADLSELGGPIEALLLMATEPLETARLAATLEAPLPLVEQCLTQLRQFYDETGRGFELRNVGGGWRLWTRTEHAEVLSRAVLEGQQARLSQAALETLAVVAYLQPVSRSRVAAVRGVNVDGVIRTLVARNLLAEAPSEGSGGAATLFRTTDFFLERMGMQDLSELPELAPHLPDAAELENELGRLAEVAPTAAEQPEAGESPESSGSPETSELPEAAADPATPGEWR